MSELALLVLLQGETLQGSYPCGCTVYAEQVSHHPPISCWQMLDHNGQVSAGQHEREQTTARKGTPWKCLACILYPSTTAVLMGPYCLHEYTSTTPIWGRVTL